MADNGSSSAIAQGDGQRLIDPRPIHRAVLDGGPSARPGERPTQVVPSGWVRALVVPLVILAWLAVLGVPYAVLPGVLAFFMEFIPVLGVFISGAAAVVIAMVHFQEVLRPLLVLAYFIIVHVIEGDVIGPRIMGKAVGIHPATGLIALVAGTELFGIWGALFAAPLAGLLQAILTAAWLELRGGKPHEILQAMTEEASQQLEQRAGLA